MLLLTTAVAISQPQSGASRLLHALTHGIVGSGASATGKLVESSELRLNADTTGTSEVPSIRLYDGGRADILVRHEVRMHPRGVWATTSDRYVHTLRITDRGVPFERWVPYDSWSHRDDEDAVRLAEEIRALIATGLRPPRIARADGETFELARHIPPEALYTGSAAWNEPVLSGYVINALTLISGGYLLWIIAAAPLRRRLRAASAPHARPRDRRALPPRARAVSQRETGTPALARAPVGPGDRGPKNPCAQSMVET